MSIKGVITVYKYGSHSYTKRERVTHKHTHLKGPLNQLMLGQTGSTMIGKHLSRVICKWTTFLCLLLMIDFLVQVTRHQTPKIDDLKWLGDNAAREICHGVFKVTLLMNLAYFIRQVLLE